MIKAFKYRLSPTRKQRETLQWTLDRCRELYNAALQERREACKYAKKSITYNQQSAQLTEIKAKVRPEYQEIGSHVLQNVLKRGRTRKTVKIYHKAICQILCHFKAVGSVQKAISRCRFLDIDKKMAI